MQQLNFEGNLTKRWQESKEQYRNRFWDDIHKHVLMGVKDIMQQLLQVEFDQIIGAEPYQRTDSRRSKRNGVRYRCLETRYGRIEDICVPRARSLDVRFSLFDRWQQVDEKVLNAMLQTYLLGRSSRCAQQIIQAFDHSLFSRGFLQRLTRRFEYNLETWLTRPIAKHWPYLFIDGMIVKIKEIDLKQRCVLWALGMDEQGNTETLGFLVLNTESQEGTERLLRDLVRRGLSAPKLIISDDSKSIENAAAMIFPHTPQQGCIFHKIKAAGRYIHNTKNRRPFLRQAADVYLKATGINCLRQRLHVFRARWRRKEPDALKSFLLGFERTITYLKYPKEHWVLIRTNNRLERFIEEVRDWTRRFGYFQGEGNLYTALFTYLCHINQNLVPDLNQPLQQKDTFYVA